MAFDLKSITRSQSKPPRILIHSMAGVGKTTFGCSAPKPVVVQIEDGLAGLDVSCFPLATRYEDVMDALGALYTEEHDFQTVVIDSLDWLEPLVWDKTCRELGVASIEAPGYGKGYVEADKHWRAFFSGITALRDERNMIVIMTAHSQVVRIEDPMLPAYDRHAIKLHKRAAAIAEEFSDVILFATVKTHVVTEDAGFNAKRSRAVTTGERLMYSTGQPAFLAKTRYPMPSPLPLSWAAFTGALSPQATAAEAA